MKPNLEPCYRLVEEAFDGGGAVNNLINRPEAKKCVVSVVSGINNAMSSFDSIIGHINALSNVVVVGSSEKLFKSYTEISVALDSQRKVIQKELPIINDAIIRLINVGAETSKVVVTTTVNASKVFPNINYDNTTVGIKSYSEACGTISSIVDDCDNIETHLSDTINAYKKLWALASSTGTNTNICNRAHEAAEKLRSVASELGSKMNQFRTEFQAFMNNASTTSNESASKITESLNAINNSFEDLVIDLPKA